MSENAQLIAVARDMLLSYGNAYFGSRMPQVAKMLVAALETAEARIAVLESARNGGTR